MITSISRVRGRLFRSAAYVTSFWDSRYERSDVPVSENIAHTAWLKHLSDSFNMAGRRVLEVGSREVCGPSYLRTTSFCNAEYIGFDYYPGRNVDVVGDAHKMSQYFIDQPKFDLILSSACFEHFAMPWLVAQEISRLLKPEGVVFVETHFSFGSHERPWHFFHFTDMGLRALFSDVLGFTCIDAGMSDPIVARFSSRSAKYLRYRKVDGLYCFSQYLGRKTREITDYPWPSLDLKTAVGTTVYPPPSTVARL